MNRLIIIGNGFDLAHGLKTSFKDFIADYLAEALNSFIKTDYYSDDLLKFQWDLQFQSNIEPNVSADDVFVVIKKLEEEGYFRIEFNSILFKRIYLKINEFNWVDLELEYFAVLLDTKPDFMVNDNPKENALQVNSQFEFLKDKLMDYLKRQEDKFDRIMLSENIFNSFMKEINRNEIVVNKFVKGGKPKSLYFLNFNYTNICYQYYKEISGINKSFNYIHGNLDRKFGDPIFGFGDELDKNYLEFEDLNNNEYFRFIKSFEYSKNQNYFSLIRFIESLPFQVHIYGHSCGLSDRTMLNTIFEHEHCKSIKVFYHGEDGENNDFVEKSYDISRHFKNKDLLRRRLVPRDMCKPMPQPIEEYKAKVNGQS